MKKQLMQLTMALAGLSVAPMVFADPAPGTGTVTFNGELTADTCVINAGDVNKIVTLDTVSAQSLPNTGDTAATTNFTISVSQCPTSLSFVAAHFETTNMDENTRNILNKATVSPADNVEVQLVDKDGKTPILLGSTGSFYPIDKNAHTATMSYYGQYYAAGQVSAGNVTAVASYTLAYQ
jgi:major type 1 subunit fimbrin (pilin)